MATIANANLSDSTADGPYGPPISAADPAQMAAANARLSSGGAVNWSYIIAAAAAALALWYVMRKGKR